MGIRPELEEFAREVQRMALETAPPSARTQRRRDRLLPRWRVLLDKLRRWSMELRVHIDRLVRGFNTYPRTIPVNPRLRYKNIFGWYGKDVWALQRPRNARMHQYCIQACNLEYTATDAYIQAMQTQGI